jgi:hypothetical protein
VVTSLNITVLRVRGARFLHASRVSFSIMLSVLSLSSLASPFSSRYAESVTAATVASQIVGKANGTNAYNYDLETERIANNHSFSNYAFRSSGSKGANATPDWIADQSQNFGLDTYEKAFHLTNWDVLSTQDRNHFVSWGPESSSHAKQS